MLLIYFPLGIALIIVGLIVWAFKQKNQEKKQVAGLKKCPQCAEEVKKEALICRFCRYEFPQEAKEEISTEKQDSKWRCSECGVLLHSDKELESGLCHSCWRVWIPESKKEPGH